MPPTDTTDDAEALIDLTVATDNATETARGLLDGVDTTTFDGATKVRLVIERDPARTPNVTTDTDTVEATDGGSQTKKNPGRGNKTNPRQLEEVGEDTSLHAVLYQIAQHDEPVPMKQVAEELRGIHPESTVSSACSSVWQMKQAERTDDWPYNYYVSDHGRATLEELGTPAALADADEGGES